MLTPNTEELLLIYKQIKTEPETWDQDVWACKVWREVENPANVGDIEHCGTAYCIAGHAVARAGYKIMWHAGQASSCKDPVTGTVSSIPSVARKILGIDVAQGDELFAAANDLEDVRYNIINLTGIDPEL